MKRTNPRVAGFALLLAASLGAACGRAEDSGEATVSPAPVAAAVATVAETEMVEAIPVTGATAPWATVSPAAKIMARIEQLPVHEGQWVERGATLARLDSRDLQAAAAQARAAVEMADAQVQNARAQEARMRRLHERGSATDKNLEDAVAALRVAEASHAQATANVQAAEVTLDYASIDSPIAGWVTRKMAEEGDTTAPGRPLLTIEDRARVKVTFQVPEAAVPGLERGQDLTLRIEVLDFETQARIDQIRPTADGSRTFDVQVVVDNRDGRIRSGMFARALIVQGTRSAIQVPLTAVVRRGQLDGVFVLDATGKARLRWLRLGERVDDRVEVLSGLQLGDRFLPVPPAGLTDGTPVQGA